jgi:nucleoside-diphosphate-sugar epimerase
MRAEPGLSHPPKDLSRETKKARIFITGIAGFIGSSIAKQLVADGHSVVGAANLSTGDLKNLLISSAK